MNKQFEMSAKYYDTFYSYRTYSQDVEAIEAVIGSIVPQAASILDVACGSHEHGVYFDDRFKVDGLDLSERFIKLAKAKTADRHFPGTYYHQSMDGFSIDSRYDAIVCLFSSIGYLPDVEALHRTFRSFRDHLNPDGVVIVEPWLSSANIDSFETSRLSTQDEIQVARLSRYRVTGKQLTLWLHYLVGDAADVDYFVEEHHMTLFSRDDYESALADNGFQWKFDPDGLSSKRGLYVCTRGDGHGGG
ncbi:class I SAM-dependent methyltransferase [Hydrogenophaga sp. 5NK40-0174]|uniref:class I SAM-dependent methyltransferase n=1 Tax=Hydrogenophaga sp. 5NK40-0174 TaxID=3127649 RepID=UPI003102634B